MKTRRQLTDPIITDLKKAKPGKRYAVADTLAPGLKVRVTDKGTKTFILWRRMPGATSPSARAIGEVGVVSLDDARQKARDWIALIKAGKDPAEVEAQQAATERAQADATFGACIQNRYFPHIAKQRNAAKVRQVVKKDLLPFWEVKPLHEITRKEIKDRVRAIARRSPAQAFAALSFLKTFFGWMRDEDDLESVPTDGMRAKRIVGHEKKHRERVLTDDELFAFWRATRPERWRAVTEQHRRLIRGRWQAVPFFRPNRKALCHGCRLLLLTAARLNEVFESQRTELTPDSAMLVVPPERFKSGSTHMIQLSVQAQTIVAQLPAKGFLLTDDGKRPAGVSTKDRNRIDRRMLLTLRALARLRGQAPSQVRLEPFVLHDLRRTVRTRLSQLKVPPHVAEMALGHGKKGLERIYDQHAHLDEIREALELWSARLTAIVTKPLRATVIELPKRGKAS